MQATANAELNSLQHCIKYWHRLLNYPSQSLSAFERKSEKNRRRSERVGMRTLEDGSAPEGICELPSTITQ